MEPFTDNNADSSATVASQNLNAANTHDSGNGAPIPAPALASSVPSNLLDTATMNSGMNGNGIESWDTGAGFLPDAFPWSFEDAFAQDLDTLEFPALRDPLWISTSSFN